MSVYVLKLANDKYYIGYSTNVYERITQHWHKKGAEWTKFHKPVKTIEILHDKDKAYETQLTLEYMRKYGWQNVRGGPYVQVNMIQPPQEFEPKMTCSLCRSSAHLVKDCTKLKNFVQSAGACYRCGRSSHWAPNCYATYHVNGKYIYD